tara:strand:- start:56 stop:802 length:747 start_codon:yes stop_codon:yes gene_type:complete
MLDKFKLKILIKLGVKSFICKFRSLFIREFQLKKWNKELFLYHGSLSKNEPQYSDPRFVGLPLSSRNHYREILCDLNQKIPLPDCCADAFQSQDVLEHLEPEKVVNCLNEVYRVLKKKGLFRLSLPDYNSLLLKKRSVFNYKGEILGDVALGSRVLTDNFNSEIYCINISPPGDAHLWFPTYKIVNKYIMESDFANASSCNWLHANIQDDRTILKKVPDNETFNISRCPPKDMRANGLPVSLIVDLIK